MSNYLKAKELLTSNIGGVIKVFILTLVVGLISWLLSCIPFIGWLISIILSVFATIFEIYILNKIIIEKENVSFTNLINESISIFKEKGWNIFMAYVVMFLCLLPVTILATCLFLIPIIGILGVSSNTAIFTGVLSSILMIIPFILIMLFASYYLAYRLYYKASCYIFDVDTTDMLKKHNTEMIKMSLILTFIMIIPFIGWLIAIILDYVYMVKLILDVNDENTENIEVKIVEE